MTDQIHDHVIDDEYISVTDVMKLYRISRPTVWARIHDGVLPAYRLGPRITRLRASEVAAAFRSAALSKDTPS